MTPSRFNVSPEWGLVMVTALWGSSFILLSLSLKGLSRGLLLPYVSEAAPFSWRAS